MILDPIAQALHHKSALGGVLSPDERARLDKWYAENDAEEMAMFERARQDRLNRLQHSIDDANASIAEETQKIQALERETERLRKEITKLESELAQCARRPA